MQNHEYLLVRHYNEVRSGMVFQLPETSTVRLAAPTDSKYREEYGYDLYQTRQMIIEDVNDGIQSADDDWRYECTDITLVDTREVSNLKPFIAEAKYLRIIKVAWEVNKVLPIYLRRVVKTSRGDNFAGREKFKLKELKDLFSIQGNDYGEIELDKFTLITKR